MRGKTDLANQKHIGQQLFGAYIRTNDLAQQRMHASKLFQVFKEERYMFWSLVALALSIPSEGTNKQLEIVQHFIEGQLKKDKATSQGECLCAGCDLRPHSYFAPLQIWSYICSCYDNNTNTPM